jgi:glutamate-1-semialdehyde 2,1-aminomutase
MSAIRLARGATGRDLIVKFAGCYHGHADHLLVSAGSGLVTFGSAELAPASPATFAELTRVLPLDDEAALDALFAADGRPHRRGDHRAGAGQQRPPAQRPEFLRHLRA